MKFLTNSKNRFVLMVSLKNKFDYIGTVSLSNINFINRKIDFYEIIIDIEVRDSNHLSNIIAALRLVSEVSSLERVKG